ncbi:hypothetical protein C0989_009680 [Termitomyces sp. Mn162]|nr:hypothetical protein C0989_009680 [Termitomyces sp. Mn162]
MLTLGPGSVCDICLEAFGSGFKAASAIVCGHAFCSECIDQLRSAPPTTNHPDPNYKPCPLCRHTFDTRTYIRLHVDHDNNTRPTVPAVTGPTVSEEDVYTVQSLLERMINIANEGSSEEESRKYIAEAKTFLQGQKDSKRFIELRTCYRMLVYTTKVRATNRQLQAQKADLEVSLSRVREEKAEVERKARDERDLALSIEKSLQDHAKLTQDGYEAMIMRDGHVVTEPGNLMVSPLAAYSALPIRPFTLPEEGEIEVPPPKSKRRSQSSTCCNSEHPSNCDCAVPCTETPQPTYQSSAFCSRSATSNDILVSSGFECQPVHADLNAPLLIAQTGCEAVGPQSTDDHDDHRSTTHRNAEHNCDHTIHNNDQPTLSHEASQPSSSLHTPGSIPHDRGSISVNETTSLAGTACLATASTLQVHSSPSHISGSTSRSQRRGSIPKRKTPDAETTPLAPTSESPSTQGFRNVMLQDLLQDAAPFSGSSSQINAPSSSSVQTPAMLCHDSHRSDQKTEPSLGYYTLPQPSPSLLAERRERHRQESLRKSENRDTQSEEIFIPPSVPIPSRATRQSHDQARVPGPTYDPSNVLLSSASSAAKAKARERAEKAEKEKCTEKDKDSIRKKAEGEERRKAKRAEAGYPEYENFTSSYPGVNSSSSKSKRPSDSCGITDGSQQGSLSYTSLHDPPPYTSASQRVSGSGSKSNRYTEKYAIDSYGHKYIPVHVLSATPRA